MPRDVFSRLLLLLLFPSEFGASHACLQDPASAYRFTGIVCRLTYPAAVVLNQKTTKVIEAAFQHARYPSVKGEKSLLFVGKVKYGLDNLEIHNLSIGRSEFELHPGEGIGLEINNVSAVFRGTIQYGYGSWLVNLAHSLDFEIESQIDLGINPKLYCGKGKVAADTSDCYLKFHKLSLHLQGDKEPNWLKKLFTDFITFTVKMAVKGQICKEINKLANILADFIQDTAEHFLTDGDISVDIGITAAPVITANYIESYHKGLTNYNNTLAVISDSLFQPRDLTENRMLYFWLSDQVLNPLVTAAHQDGRFQLNISGAELTELFQTDFPTAMPEFIRKCLLESGSPELHIWSSSVPYLNTSTWGTTVWAMASGKLHCGSQGTPTLFFETAVVVDVTASYANKKVFLQGNPTEIFVKQAELPSQNAMLDETHQEFIREAVEKIGVPKALSVLETEITRLLNKQGVHLFDIFNPKVHPRDGFVVIEMDFGFPHHLLVEFLRKTLQ
uniref:cholesteryl ester transfer protein n=1 Tax=Scatophagus argus TaxID=75038 RepID=UPI001ED7D48E|nr:cholesteryl ester transfer protein [Scatophagus argus]XP_046249510.1 cholesteryl ester transfer protein [Scatophagus argus]XP_046249511.1 cholesteryl ester transfer protein [Scatophagus argus]XP_046249512.1 cholesteryl ester transfer protein [Scatophagus argus]